MNPSTVNEGARSLNPYSPGLSAERARSLYQRSEFVKLASNENAYGPAPAVKDRLRQAWVVERYPDPDQRGLVEALASHYGLPTDNIVVGAGSSELLDRIARLLLCPGKAAVYSQYAFSLYRQYALGCNAKPIEIAATKGYGHDLAAMAAAVDEDVRLVYIASPNNPTGTYSREEELRGLLESIPEDVIVVIDQAYAEYAGELAPDYPSLIGWHQRYPNLVITRTFSKIHALAGLRVGYAIADSGIVDWLRRIRQPFNVSQLGQDAACIALAEQEYQRRCARDNAVALASFGAAAQELGLEVIASAANFITFKTAMPARQVYEGLMGGGIIARTLDEYGLDHHLRLTMGLAGENQRALELLRKIVADGR